MVLPKDVATDPAELRTAVQRVMSSDCGVVRDADGLRLATQTLVDLARIVDDLPGRTVASYEVMNVLRVSRAIVACATLRLESRGSHTRRDYPQTSDALLGRFVVRSRAVPVFVALPALAVGGHS